MVEEVSSWKGAKYELITLHGCWDMMVWSFLISVFSFFIKGYSTPAHKPRFGDNLT